MQFQDPMGRTWTPQFDTNMFYKFSKDTGIPLSIFQNFEALPFWNLLDLIWYSCETEAGKLRISKRDFFATAIPLKTANDISSDFTRALLIAFLGEDKVVALEKEAREKADSGEESSADPNPETATATA